MPATWLFLRGCVRAHFGALAAFPLVVPPTLACRLGLRVARRLRQGLPFTSSVGALAWARPPGHHPRVFFWTASGFVPSRRKAPSRGVRCRAPHLRDWTGITRSCSPDGKPRWACLGQPGLAVGRKGDGAPLLWAPHGACSCQATGGEPPTPQPGKPCRGRGTIGGPPGVCQGGTFLLGPVQGTSTCRQRHRRRENPHSCQGTIPFWIPRTDLK